MLLTKVKKLKTQFWNLFEKWTAFVCIINSGIAPKVTKRGSETKGILKGGSKSNILAQIHYNTTHLGW